MSLCFLSAAEQARRFAAGELSARELTSAYLERIAAADEELGAYLHVDAEGALARADQLDAARARGETLGPLAGVPVALKDALVTDDMPTTAGSKMLAGWRAPYDGDAAARLRAAGAVILGKLNMDEFAMGSSNEHSAYRRCRNPWDPERVPGGSSGGSAAAVAAGLCAAALGSDTGGSIRQPAALCGVVGLKPTYGRVSRYGLVAFASSLDQIGPLGRTVEDCALLLEVIAGVDPRDATSLDAPVPRYRDALAGGAQGLRVGIADELGADQADPEVRAAFEAAVAQLSELGATVTRVSLPHTRYALPAYYLVAPAEASSNLARYDGVRYGHRAAGAASLEDLYADSRHEGFGTEVVRRIMLGTFALRAGYYDAYYKKAQQARALIRRDFERAFEEVDVIASPVTPSPAFRFGEKSEPIDMYLADIFTLSASLAGIPGASVPCGLSQAGLPIGLQLLGRPLGEDTVVRAAAAYERATDWSARRPPEVA